MADKWKVLKALKHHKETAVCNGCPYAEDDDTPQGNCPVYDDAITLLLEQEHARPEWISVKTRLPMLIETVLFAAKNCHDTQRGYYDGSLWHSDSNGTFYSTTPVTHWMHLPEPPKEVSGDEKGC